MKKTIYIVFILYFFQGLIHNLGHPITPGFVNDLGMENMFGTFFALMSLGLAVGGPVWGILGDRYNKKGLILIGLLIYSFGQYMFGNVHNIYVMVLFRFISGFGVSASVTLLLSYLLEKSKLKYKKTNIAISLALMAVGASVGYFVGGYLPNILNDASNIVGLVYATQAKSVFLLQAILNTIFAFSIYFLIEDSTLGVQNGTTVLDGIKSIKYLNKNLLIFLTSLTFISMAAINISKYLEVLIVDLGHGSEGVGTFVAVTGLVGITTTLFIVPLIIKLKRDMMIMLLVNVLSAVIIYFVFRTGNLMLTLYTLFMFYVVLKSIYAPLETSYISNHADEGEYGKIMGIRQFFFAIGFVVGPVVANFLYNINPIYVFDMSVIMFMIGFVLLLIIRKNIQNEL